MAQTLRDVMTTNPRTVDVDDALIDAARVMRDEDVGAVVVIEGEQVNGILTDRDIVIRAVADDRDADETTVGEIASREIVALSPDEPLDRAIDMMRERSVRRLPVVENGKPVGIVSLGDLAIERDSKSVLAEISAAPANA